jgi:hypothetical protein
VYDNHAVRIQEGVMRAASVSVLVMLSLASPLHAQGPAFSLARAAREEAVRQAAAQPVARAPMSPAFKWTGIGMLIGGGVALATGVLVDNACLEDGDHDVDFCEDLQTAWIASGAAIAAGGAVVLLVGNGRRASSAPAISVSARRVALQVRF